MNTEAHKVSEYRVRPITRYIVTHFHSENDGNGSNSGGCQECGEFSNEAQANRMGAALSMFDPGSTFVGIPLSVADNG
jgi:hypothetical protein